MGENPMPESDFENTPISPQQKPAIITRTAENFFICMQPFFEARYFSIKKTA